VSKVKVSTENDMDHVRRVSMCLMNTTYRITSALFNESECLRTWTRH